MISLLNEKRAKNRFQVKDPKVVEKFCEYMFTMLQTKGEVEVIMAFEELIPKIRNFCV